MKKILIGMLFCGLAFIGQSQNAVTSMTGSGVQLLNTTPGTLLIPTTYTHNNVSLQVVITKDSGTVAGSGVLQASNDGTNYYTISTDSMLLTNVATNKKIWVLTGANFIYYRVYLVGVGTMAAKKYGYFYSSGTLGKHLPATNFKSSYNLNSDTVTNSGTTYVGITVNNWYTTMSVQPVVTKLSGTCGGTVTLQGSNDGTNYSTVSSAFVDATTMTALNQTTTTKLLTITGSPYKYYRLSYTGTGTMSATLKGYLVVNKR